MGKNISKGKVSLFKNDKITLVRSNGDKMPGRVTELSEATFWVKYKNPGRWAPDSEIGDVVNMILHYENFELPFSAKVIQRDNPGEIAVDVCYEAGDDVTLVQRHDQYRKAARFPIYIRKILNLHDHIDYVTRPKEAPKSEKHLITDQYIPCRSLDISASGIRVQTEQNFAKGAMLECIFKLEGHLMVAVATAMTRKQRRSSAFEYGLEFQKIHPDNVKKIIKYVYKSDKK